jgi:hypothetical protein
MAYSPFTAITEAPSEKEEDLQKKYYFLDPLPDASPEEARRDRLAHLLLIGLKAVKARKGERSGV